MRLAAMQDCPLLRNLARSTPATATDRSVSSNTIVGACPPSSSDNRVTLAADNAIRCWPTSVEPVNDTLRTRRSANRVFATVDPGPVMTLRTPGGTPASTARRPNSIAVSGVWDAGLTTCVHPDASAGPTLRVIIASGKFHGVIAAVTPTG